ncbi:hypothetical protein GTR02_18085, partial [Kineococcus sp. R8]
MRRSRSGTTTASAAALLLGAVLLPAAPAGAAEAGAAHGGSGDERRASARTCTMFASGSGSYGIQCAGTKRWPDFVTLLGGAPPPTCWLLPVDSDDDTPEDAAPPRPE